MHASEEFVLESPTYITFISLVHLKHSKIWNDSLSSYSGKCDMSC